MWSAKNLSNPKPLGLDEDLYVFNLFRLTGHEEKRDPKKPPKERSIPAAKEQIGFLVVSLDFETFPFFFKYCD
jgi:hypothetical protein